MSSKINDENSIEMPDNYEIPSDIDAVIQWAGVTYSFLGVDNADSRRNAIVDTIPPPPPLPNDQQAQVQPQQNNQIPPPPPLPTAQNEVQKLESDMDILEQKVARLTKALLACGKECETAPLDKKHWEKMLLRHQSKIEQPHKDIQQKQVELGKRIKDIIQMPGADQFKSNLRGVKERLDDIEYDFLLDQYKESKEENEKRIQTIVEASEKAITEMRNLEKQLIELEQKARDGLDVSSWNPNGSRNQYAVLRIKAEMARDNLPNQITPQAHEAANDLYATMTEVRASLLEELAKKIDFLPKAEAIAQECQQVIVDSDSDNFDLKSWNPMQNGKKWVALKTKADTLENEMMGVEVSNDVKYAMGVIDDLFEILCEKAAKAHNEQAVEIMMAPEVFNIDAESKTLKVEVEKLGNIATILIQDINLVSQGVNCDTNEQRKAAWNALNKDCLPLPGFPWTLAMQQFQSLGARLNRAQKAMPWNPANLAKAAEAYGATEESLKKAAQNVSAAKASFDQFNDPVCNYDGDIDLGQLAAMGLEAEYIKDEFNKIGGMASNYVQRAKEIVMLDASEEQREEWLALPNDWMPGPGTPFDEASDLLDELVQKYTNAKSLLSWVSPSLQELGAAIDDAKWHLNFNKAEVQSAYDYHNEHSGQILDDDIDLLVDDGDETPGAKTPGNDEENNDENNDGEMDHDIAPDLEGDNDPRNQNKEDQDPDDGQAGGAIVADDDQENNEEFVIKGKDEMETPKDPNDDLYDEEEEELDDDGNKITDDGFDEDGLANFIARRNSIDVEDAVDDDTDLSEFIQPLTEQAVLFVKGRGFDEADYQNEINSAVKELMDDLRDAGNHAISQMRDKLPAILGDVPKVMNVRLPEEEEQIQQQGSIIPDGMEAKIKEQFKKRFGNISDEDEELWMGKIIDEMKHYYRDDAQQWEEYYGRIVYLNHKKYEDENKSEWEDLGFELTANYWSSKKGNFADRKGLLTKALADYEEAKASAIQAQGFNRMFLLARLPHVLDHVWSVAADVQKNLHKKRQKKSRKLILGVPFAIEQDQKWAKSEFKNAANAFSGISYATVRNNNATADLWEAFLKDKGNRSHWEQEHFATRYTNEGGSQELKQFAIDNLNLADAAYDFEIDDDDAWKVIYDKTIFQLQQAFPIPFFEFVRDLALAKAKKLAEKDKK